MKELHKYTENTLWMAEYIKTKPRVNANGSFQKKVYRTNEKIQFGFLYRIIMLKLIYSWELHYYP